jgi:hypothetical protein
MLGMKEFSRGLFEPAYRIADGLLDQYAISVARTVTYDRCERHCQRDKLLPVRYPSILSLGPHLGSTPKIIVDTPSCQYLAERIRLFTTSSELIAAPSFKITVVNRPVTNSYPTESQVPCHLRYRFVDGIVARRGASSD